MSALLDALGYVGSSLDKPGRAVRGILGGRPEESLAAIPFSDAMGLTNQDNAVSGRHLLEKLGVVDQDSGFLGDVAGMGTEMALDPLNLVGGALAKRALGMGKAARESNALREALLAKGAMPPEIAKLTKAVDAEGKPLKLFHGTPHAFDQFDMAKMDKQALYGPGIYMTDNPQIASEYAEKGAVPARTEYHRRPEAESQIDYVVKNFVDPYYDEPANLSHSMVDSFMRDPALIDPMSDFDTKLFEDLKDYYRPVEIGGSPQNVRAHFLDTRKPFNIDAQVPVPEIEALDRAGGNLLGNMPDHRYRQYLAGKLDSLAGEGVYDMLKDAEYFQPGGRRMSHEVAHDVLHNAGYDAIRHEGGHRMGNGEVLHNVYIAHDPSQVYAPLVAPELQTAPRISPLLAALMAQNTLRGAR